MYSNSYILYSESEIGTWIVDPGDSEQLVAWMSKNNKVLKGILLTHYHYDHIYGVLDLLVLYKNIQVYASRDSVEGLSSARMNGSLYAGKPYVVGNECISYVREGSKIKLFKDHSVLVYQTPGHNKDCVSYHVNDCLFTGDALIPGVRVHLRSKQSNKTTAYQTIDRIFKEFNPGTMIYPGHKEKCLLKDIKVPR